MSPPVLTLTNIGKAFRRYRREIDRVAGWFGARRTPLDEHWVLRHIDFAVPAGQALGIVGRNGAGKSTLLKMITGTMRPTEGRVELAGKVSAILELGMGFNPEFSGRQNAYQAAGMMGYSRADIDRVIGDIIDFSELGDYFDQPLRVYSSGMQVRLAFSVATAFRPDILIIDEALSVGDAYFQHKSFERIRAFRAQGTTLILVSHDKVALQSICDRAILLDNGAVARDGDPESVLDYYNALIAQKEGESIETVAHPSGRIQTISGSGLARIDAVELVDDEGKKLDTVGVGTMVNLRVRARAQTDLPQLVIGYAIKDRLGVTLFGTNTFYTGQSIADLKEGEQIECVFRFPVVLGPGAYSVTLALSGAESHLSENYEWRDLALLFTVVNLRQPFDGIIHLPPEVELRRGQRAETDKGAAASP